MHALEFALFFCSPSLNLVWFAIRNVSVAVDEFVAFELLEVIRRVGHLAVTLAMLAGLSLMMFLIIANVIWVLLFAWAIARLDRTGRAGRERRRPRQSPAGIFARQPQGGAADRHLCRERILPLQFPLPGRPSAFGLGAPTIILDTAFKVFRGATVLYSAGCDLAFRARPRPSPIATGRTSFSQR